MNSSRNLSRRLFPNGAFVLLACFGLHGGSSAQTITGSPLLDHNGNPVHMMITHGECPIYDTSGAGATSQRKVQNQDLFKDYLVGSQGAALDQASNVAALFEALESDGQGWRRVGFFKAADVLIGRTEAIHATRKDSNGKVMPSSLYLKALVVTDLNKVNQKWRLEDLQSGRVVKVKGPDGQIMELASVPAVSYPGATSTVDKNVKGVVALYDHYYVWKEEVRDHISWLLLGTRFQYADSTEPPQNFMLGWVPKERTYEWNTAQALEWDWESRKDRLAAAGGDEEKAKGHIYANEHAAREFGAPDLNPPQANNDLFATEALSMLDTETNERKLILNTWSPVLHRYPLFLHDTEGENAANPMFHLGFIGGIYGPDGIIMEKDAFDIAKQKQEDTVRGLYTLDLVILIDGTKSMNHLREPTKNAVRKIIRQVKDSAPERSGLKEKNPIARCAIGVYRNTNEVAGSGLESFEFVGFHTLSGESGEGLAAIESFLNSIVFDSSEQKIREEAVFSGIVKSVESAALQQKGYENSYRMMIVVGDSGNLSPGTDAGKVATVLNENKYDFYAVSVPDESEVKKWSDYKAFRTELADLAGELELPKASVKTGEVFAGSSRVLKLDGRDFVAAIKEACGRGLELRNNVVGALMNPTIYPTELQAYAKRILAQNGVSEGLLQQNKVQLFSEGFSPEFSPSGKTLWKVMINVERETLNRYITYLRPFAQLAGTSSGKIITLTDNQIEAVITAMKQTFAFQAKQVDLDKVALSDALGDSGIDLPMPSKLLKMTMGQLRLYLGRRGEAEALERTHALVEFSMSYKVLEAYTLGRRFTVVDDPDPKTGKPDGYIDRVIVNPDGMEGKYWVLRNGAEFTWIPMEYFP